MTQIADPTIIDPTKTVRILAQKAALDPLFNHALQHEFFAPGTNLYEGAAGEKVFEKKRPEWEQRDLLTDGALRYERQIGAEKRRDHLVGVDRLRMLAGGLLSTDEGIFSLEEPSLRKLCGWVAPRKNLGPYLATCPANLRAFNFNFWAQRASDTVAQARERGGDASLKATEFGDGAALPVNALLRTRLDASGQGRKISAIVSPSYGLYDAFEFLLDVAKVAPEGARVEITYDGAETTFDITWHAPASLKGKDVGVGETFKLGVRGRTNDAGLGQYEFWRIAERIRCRNVSTLSEESDVVASRVHRGSKESMRRDVLAAFQKATEGFEVFFEQWNAATKDEIFKGDQDARTKIYRLADQGLLRLPGLTAQDSANRIYTSWQKEPGNTRADLYNAVTRLHESAWTGSVWTLREVEQQAARLLHVKNLNLN